MKRMTNDEKKLLANLVLDLLQNNNDNITLLNSKAIIRIIPTIGNDVNLRKIINLLRQNGEPIISSNRGYRYTTDIVDLFLYSHSLKLRIMEITRAYTGLITYVKENTPEINDFI